jgi:acyl carrier protein
MKQITFEQLVVFIRKNAYIPKGVEITSETRFKEDLEITSDDGNDLLEDLDKEFKLNLTLDDFELNVNENLFEPDSIIWSDGFISLFSHMEKTVHNFTVGELYSVIQKVIARNEISSQNNTT